ncbi:MAG: hypothetical protein ACJAXX_001677 [Roseivirga sp.]|jgi:hypothetical protein
MTLFGCNKDSETYLMKYIHHFKAHLFLLASFLTFSACSLVELDEVPTPKLEVPEGKPSNNSDFTFALASSESRTWSASGFTLEGLNGFQSCRLDDSFIFFANGTYRYDGGAVLCGGADDSRIKTGIWEIEIENSLIVFDRETDIEHSATVKGLNNGKILLQSKVDIFGRFMKIEGVYETENSN